MRIGGQEVGRRVPVPPAGETGMEEGRGGGGRRGREEVKKGEREELSCL